MSAGKYDIERIRRQMQQKLTKSRDPNEYVPPKKVKEPTYVRFYVLPGLAPGEKCAEGEATAAIDMFWVNHGSHWINKKPHACPRICNDELCEICDTGFELMKEVSGTPKQVKDAKSAIAKQWLSQQQWVINIWFPDEDCNPEDLRGKNKFFRAGKQVFDILEKTISRKNGGDKADPVAFGCFYDPENAYLFQLAMEPGSSGWNDYKTSKFLAQLGPHPIAADGEGTPDMDKIQEILDGRFDLFQKLDKPNPDTIRKLCEQMASGAINLDSPTSGADDSTQDHEQPHEAAATNESLESERPVASPPPSQKAPPPTRVATPTAKPAASKPATTQVATKPAVTTTTAAAKPATKTTTTTAAKSTPAPKPVETPAPVDETPGDGSDVDDVASLLDQLEVS